MAEDAGPERALTACACAHGHTGAVLGPPWGCTAPCLQRARPRRTAQQPAPAAAPLRRRAALRTALCCAGQGARGRARGGEGRHAHPAVRTCGHGRRRAQVRGGNGGSGGSVGVWGGSEGWWGQRVGARAWRSEPRAPSPPLPQPPCPRVCLRRACGAHSGPRGRQALRRGHYISLPTNTRAAGTCAARATSWRRRWPRLAWRLPASCAWTRACPRGASRTACCRAARRA